MKSVRILSPTLFLFAAEALAKNAVPLPNEAPVVRNLQTTAPSTVLNEEFCQVYYALDDGKCEALRDSIRSEIRGQGTPTLELGDPSEKPVMMFIHGWPDTYALWANQFAHFCGDGGEYACVAPSLMDYNPDIAPADESKLLWPLQADMIHEVVTDLGLTNITLVIHDFGSIIGSQYVYRHPDAVKRVVNMDIANNPGASPPLSDDFMAFLTFFQKDAIAAFRAKNDTMMDENIKAIAALSESSGFPGPPCTDCMIAPESEVGAGYRTGWNHNQFVSPEWQGLFDKPLDEWEFFFTPSWPDEVPVLFLWATPGFHNQEYLDWLDSRGDGSGHEKISFDHWFMTRDTVAETHAAMEEYLAATETGTATMTTATAAAAEATTAATTASAENLPEDGDGTGDGTGDAGETETPDEKGDAGETETPAAEESAGSASTASAWFGTLLVVASASFAI